MCCHFSTPRQARRTSWPPRNSLLGSVNLVDVTAVLPATEMKVFPLLEKQRDRATTFSYISVSGLSTWADEKRRGEPGDDVMDAKLSEFNSSFVRKLFLSPKIIPLSTKRSPLLSYPPFRNSPPPDRFRVHPTTSFARWCLRWRLQTFLYIVVCVSPFLKEEIKEATGSPRKCKRRT